MRFIKKDIVAVFSQLPLPEFAGDRQMVNNHLKNLSTKYNVSAVIICTESPTEEVHSFLKEHTVSYKIFQLSKFQILKNLIIGFISNEPLQVGYYYSKEIQSFIDKTAVEKDIFFCCNIRTAKYAAKCNLPKFIDLIDSISLNYKRSFKNVKSLLWKIIYWYESRKLYQYERKIISTFNASFVVNFNEKEYWSSELKTNTIIWLPNGIKPHLFDYNKKIENWHQKSIVFLGKMDYQPNIDAVLWFIDNVYHLLDKDIQFFVIGARPTKKILKKAKPFKNIHIEGYLEDPYLIINSSNLIVSPMQTGGGVQNKILEGMAMAKVNVSTKLGADSILYAEDNKHFFVEDNPIKMAELINEICNNPNENGYMSMGKEAKKLVKDVYTWNNHGEKVIETLEKLSEIYPTK